MQVPLVVPSDNVFTLLRSSGRPLALSVGDFIQAEVIGIIDARTVSLAVTTAQGQTGIMPARTEVPLEKGEQVVLQVLGGGREMRLRLVGATTDTAVATAQRAQGDVHEALLQVLNSLRNARPADGEIRDLFAFFRSLPDAVKRAFPELLEMERLLPDVERLTGQVLKNSVERSGVLFETRLGRAVHEIMAQGRSETLARLLGPEPDLKSLALRLGGLMKEERFGEALRAAGVRSADVADALDRMVRNIEFFQASSKMNDMLYTFLPVSWREVRDGEFSVRRRQEADGESFTCDLTLDFERGGRVTASVTLFDSVFYVTINAADAATRDLLTAARPALEARFAAAGLDLRAVNIGRQRDISPGGPPPQGLDVRA